MKKEYDFLVFIGRFQPFHNGHLHIIKEAAKRADRVIVVLGSAHSSRSLRNPFTFKERAEMIRSAVPDEIQNIPGQDSGLYITEVIDHPYNEQGWLREVQISVNSVMTLSGCMAGPGGKVGLIGHQKDESTYYLKMFPNWDVIDVDQSEFVHYIESNSDEAISATAVRKRYFASSTWPLAPEMKHVPEAIIEFLDTFEKTVEYLKLQSEWHINEKYKESWNRSPYEPIFVTTDAVVVQSGHILMVERGAEPGKGLFALPGGFVGNLEKLEDSMIRELREETKLKVPEPVLRGSIKKTRVFDAPYRSDRGRTITHAYLIELNGNDHGLPSVKGSDDAKHAAWIPLAALNSEQIFEDHYHIITELVGGSLNWITPTMQSYMGDVK